MGQPKSLLQTPAGLPLAVHQARLLNAAGCVDPIVVLGSAADQIAPVLMEAGIDVVVNANWEHGRFGSFQTGIRARPGVDGYLILPVDTVGVRRDTLAQLVREGPRQTSPVFRPRYNGAIGRILWLRTDLADQLAAEPLADLALDRTLNPRAAFLSVDDPAILNNTNTPEEWATARHGL